MMKLPGLILVAVLLVPFSFAHGFDSAKKDLIKTTESTPVSVEESSRDGKAEVEAIEGVVLITKKGNPSEIALKIGDSLEKGDRVYTERGASLTIAFDVEQTNTVKIPAETEAIFSDIEPTTIRLNDGSIFSAFDGLPQGSTWQVITPSVVTAVRGTQFEVAYRAASGEFSAATFDDEDDKKNSAVELKQISGGSAIQIQEGKELTLGRGQSLSRSLVKPVAPERAIRFKQFQKQVGEQRRKKSEMIKERKQEKQGHGPGGPGGLNGPGGGAGGASGAGGQLPYDRPQEGGQPNGPPPFGSLNPGHGPGSFMGTSAPGEDRNSGDQVPREGQNDFLPPRGGMKNFSGNAEVMSPSPNGLAVPKKQPAGPASGDQQNETQKPAPPSGGRRNRMPPR